MTRNQNHDDDDAPWSDVNHDVLLLIMMQLGFVDFFAFSGDCKSWRSLALSNRNRFMTSRPRMKIWRNQEDYFYLEDLKERRFKTLIPNSADRNFFGVTCGYLILMGEETRDFLLVNPITRHQLHFPDLHLLVGARDVNIRAILVFSPSISGWVFVVLYSTHWWYNPKLSFYIDGKNGWNHVSSTVPIVDIHFFKGKIYTLHTDRSSGDCSVGELRLYPNRECKWTLLETKNFPKQDLYDPELVSSCEKLFVISRNSNPKKVMELDIGEMKWMWYFPHDCLTVNSLKE